MALKIENCGDGEKNGEIDESGGCVIPPGESRMLSSMPLTYGESLVFGGADGLVKVELKPIAVDTGMRRPAVAAFEMVFDGGVRVLLDYPDTFSSDAFKISYAQEYGIVNEEYLKLCLGRVAPGIEFEMGEGLVKIRNTAEEVLSCDFRKRTVDKGSSAENGPAGYRKSRTGADGSFEGELKDGIRYAVRTVAMPGASAKNGWNEDSAGCGLENGRLIVADGLGGVEFGECASAFMVEEMLRSGQRSLTEAAREAHYRLYVYNRHMLSQSLEACDTVLAALQFNGTEYEAVNFGDTCWIQIRNGKVMARGRRHSLVQKKVDEGELTPLEALAHPSRNYVTKTVGTAPMEPDIQRGQTEKGDTFWIFSDGLALLEEEMCKISGLVSLSPVKAADMAMEITTKRNDKGQYLALSGGVGMEIPAPGDNATVIVVKV